MYIHAYVYVHMCICIYVYTYSVGMYVFTCERARVCVCVTWAPSAGFEVCALDSATLLTPCLKIPSDKDPQQPLMVCRIRTPWSRAEGFCIR